jgi:adenine/guanine/hypoxanthine permease
MASTTTESAVERGLIERRFEVEAPGNTPRIEVVAGITSFLAAAYFLIAIPSLLATGAPCRRPPALAGRFREVHWVLVVLAVPLGYYFWTVVGSRH